MDLAVPNVLVATQDETLTQLCQQALNQSSFRYRIQIAGDWRAATVWAHRRSPQLILLGKNLFIAHGHALRENLLSATPKPALIVVDREEDVEAAIAAFSSGAIGYVSGNSQPNQTLRQLSRTAEWALRRAGHLPPRGRILVVDDSPEMLNTLADVLKIEGFEVFTARSAPLAETLYRQELVHLAVIDVRLEKGDDDDLSGLDLARRIDPLVPCVIMTAHPSVEGVRQALVKIGAIDYLVKPKGELDELLDAIIRAFEAQVHINWQLRIDWGEDLSLSSLVQMLKDYRDADPDAQARAAIELEELLRKLFLPPVDRIRVRYVSPGRGGSGVVMVIPYRDTLEAETVVVKFGRRDDMERERRHYQQFVLPFAGRWSTQLRGEMAATLSFAGLKFSFVGLSSAIPRDFNTYYLDPSVSASQVCRALQMLFEENCRLWYRGKRHWAGEDDQSLARSYEEQLNLDRPSKRDKLRAHVDALLDERPVGRLLLRPLDPITFAVETVGTGPRQRFVMPHPLPVIRQGEAIPPPSYICITHGDLNGRNLFVDEAGHSWLIDFFKSGWGPVLRDVAELESVIKFELLKTTDLLALLAFERTILRPARFDQQFVLDPALGVYVPELQRAVTVIGALRRLAQRLGDVWTTEEYDVGLLYYALKTLTQRGITPQERARYPVRARHALLSAALICEKLKRSQDRNG